jgi:hypothetical protein
VGLTLAASRVVVRVGVEVATLSVNVTDTDARAQGNIYATMGDALELNGKFHIPAKVSDMPLPPSVC